MNSRSYQLAPCRHWRCSCQVHPSQFRAHLAEVSFGHVWAGARETLGRSSAGCLEMRFRGVQNTRLRCDMRCSKKPVMHFLPLCSFHCTSSIFFKISYNGLSLCLELCSMFLPDALHMEGRAIRRVPLTHVAYKRHLEMAFTILTAHLAPHFALRLGEKPKCRHLSDPEHWRPPQCVMVRDFKRLRNSLLRKRLQ